jgi:hypothetical protein
LDWISMMSDRSAGLEPPIAVQNTMQNIATQQQYRSMGETMSQNPDNCNKSDSNVNVRHFARQESSNSAFPG